MKKRNKRLLSNSVPLRLLARTVSPNPAQPQRVQPNEARLIFSEKKIKNEKNKNQTFNKILLTKMGSDRILYL